MKDAARDEVYCSPFFPNFPPANRHSIRSMLVYSHIKRSEQLCHTAVQLLDFCVGSVHEGRPEREDTGYNICVTLH